MWNVLNRSRPTATLEPPKQLLIDLWSDWDGSDSQPTASCETKPAKRHDCAQVEMIGTIAIITILLPELRHHQGALTLADMLDQIVQAGVEHIVFDLQNVIYMDTGCVGCLIDALNRMSQNGGRIALANPAPCVTHLLGMTKLDRVFPVCSDVLAAIRAVERPR